MEALLKKNKGSEKELRILALGKTGAGKSYTGNTILQVSNLFETKCSSVSVTKICRSKTATVNGRVIRFVDTPGLFDTSCGEDQLKSEILRSMPECAPGPHVFLIILKVGTYTRQEMEIVKKITETFGEEALNYAVVLFTCGDNLENGQTIEGFVRENSQLKNLVDKCGSRCHVIDNKDWNQQNDEYRNNRVQIDRLLKTIDEMVKRRGGGCYTNELLEEVQRNLHKEAQVVRAESNGRLSEEQIRQETVNRVHTKLSVRIAGVTTGFLLGALLGVKERVHFVLKIIKKTDYTMAKAAVSAAVALASSNGSSTVTALEIAVGGVLVGAAALGAVTGGAVGYEAVEGEETVLGAIKKTVEACIDNMGPPLDQTPYKWK